MPGWPEVRALTGRPSIDDDDVEEITTPLIRRVIPSVTDLQGLEAEGATYSQTLFNLVNIFIGLGLLSCPYAFKAGGYVSGVLLLTVIAPLFCLSGHLIVAAFQYLPLTAPRSYPELGKLALGKHGRKVVAGLAFVELAGGVCMVLLVTWQQLLLLVPSQGLLGWSARETAVAISLVWIVPMLFVGKFGHLAVLSRLGLLSVGLVATVVLALPVRDPHREQLPQPPPSHSALGPSLAQAVGIFAVSLSGHTTLPALRAGMSRPSQFPAVLRAAFGVMALTYGGVGAAGYWYYGDATAALVTTNISAAGAWASSHLDRGLACLLLVSCATKYPALVLVLQDLLLGLVQGSSPQARRHPPRPAFLTALRVLLCAASVAASYAAFDAVAGVMALVGSVASLSCSLLMPVLFYALLAWKELGRAARAGLAALLALGAVLMVYLTTQNILQLTRAPHA